MTKKACFACHQINEGGGQVGPNLTRAGWMYPPEWLYVWLYDPQSIRPNTKMLKMGLQDDQFHAVVSYLMAQKDEEVYLTLLPDSNIQKTFANPVDVA